MLDALFGILYFVKPRASPRSPYAMRTRREQWFENDHVIDAQWFVKPFWFRTAELGVEPRQVRFRTRQLEHFRCRVDSVEVRRHSWANNYGRMTRLVLHCGLTSYVVAVPDALTDRVVARLRSPSDGPAFS